MSDQLGPRTFGAREEMVFLGREISDRRNYGEQVAREIDQEIKRIIETAHAKAKEILTGYREVLDAVANRLIAAETIDGDELAQLVRRPEFAPSPEWVNAPIPIS
jgi:cell division protease FtsH